MSAEKKEKTYSLVWCGTSYRRYNDGFIVHALDDEAPDQSRTLCGAKWSDSGWGVVGEDGEPGCIKCRKALRKLGVMEPLKGLGKFGES